MHINYSNIISIENLFQAWNEFRKGKAKRPDVRVFERNLEDNLFKLQENLANKVYRHGNYQSFYVNDPKQRHIHKASVSDRVVHHLLYTFLYNLSDKSFIFDSYSCRLGKGTHKGVKRLEKFTRKVSQNYTTDCWALKCDIKKFFASVDHEVLKKLIEKRVIDKDILWLLSEIIASFCICHQSEMLKQVQHDNDGNHKGMPLGNLTSQVFANIYLNELDQFIKHELRIKYYLRYADDFLLILKDSRCLETYTEQIKTFLYKDLKLLLHPKKINIRRLDNGIDFLGYIILPHIILPRTKTKRRIFKKLKEKFKDFNDGQISEFSFNQTVQSYSGYLKHSNSFKLRQLIAKSYG